MIINNYFFCIEILFHDYETRKSNTSSIGHHDTTIVNLVFRSYNNLFVYNMNLIFASFFEE